MKTYINKETIVDLLSDLVKIHSPYFEEDEVMDYVYNWMKDKEIPVEYHRYHEDKIYDYHGTNVIGRLKGQEKGPRILLNGHLDTVNICEGWERNPLVPSIEGDRMYGLGALDMKAGCAAIMLAVYAFKNLNKDFKGEILYTLVSDEEGPLGLGTDSLILDGITKDVDMAIIPEPSSGFTGVKFPALCLGARGGFSYTIEFIGKSAHAANPEKGVNAAVDAGRVAIELEKTDLIEDEKLGKGSIAIIGLSSGSSACSVVDNAKLEVFRHTVRGESREDVVREIEEAIERAGIRCKYKISLREGTHKDNSLFEPFVVDENNTYVEAFKSSVLDITKKEASIEYFSSIGDFNYVGSRVGVPTLIFGPDGENYHTHDEFVYIDTAVDTALIIYDYLVKTLV